MQLAVANIFEAHTRIDRVFLHSPQYACDPLSEAVGCDVTLKVETANPLRSFKGRGASYFVATLADAAPLVCASAGNFGQAMAYACRARGIPLTVFAPRTASSLALARMRALGATVRVVGHDLESARAEARTFPARLVEDGREPAIAEGAGTIAIELLARGARFDAILVPLGDGALLGGVARVFAAITPATRVIGVCSRAAPAMWHAWRGEPLADPEVRTIAGGIAIRIPFADAIARLRGCVHDVVAVDDASLVDAMRMIHAHAGLVTEPSGVAGLAAILEDRHRFAGMHVATIVSGSSLDASQFQSWITTERT